MTTANKLTILRVILIPVFLVLLYLGFPGCRWAALAVFIVARLADKMLVMAAMCYLVEVGEMYGWVLALVLLREFAVSGMRLVAVEQGRVIAAGWSGKVKTASTMVCLCLMLVVPLLWLNLLCQAVILVSTLYSGTEYLVKNKDVFKSA